MLEQSRTFSRPQRREMVLQRVAADETFGLDRYTSHRALVRALRELGLDVETIGRVVRREVSSTPTAVERLSQ